MGKFVLSLILLFLPQLIFADFGRLAFIRTTSDSLYYGEIIAARDSVIVLSSTPFAEDRQIYRQLDSLIIVRCNEIDYAKILERPASFSQRIKFSTFVALIGGGLLAARYEQITATDWLILPLSVALGYLLGAYFDISNYKNEEIIYPDCSNKFYAVFSEHSRYKNAEPKSFARKLNQMIERQEQ